MNLPIDLISKFVKITNDKTETKKESTVYGTARIHAGATYVQLDGSNAELLTPVSATADVKDGERVTVLIKNHTATITGNLSSPAARIEDVENLGYDIVECNILITGKADTEDLDAESARIDTLEADNVTINQTLNANKADIDALKTDKLDVEDAKITYANIDFSNINKSAMEYLYSTSGLIKDVMIGDGTITGQLVGVTIGGLNPTSNSIYSGVKSSIDNATQGVYLDNEGQFFLGDSTQFIRYYKDENGVYRLEMAFYSNEAGASVRPYYCAGDSVSIDICTAGFVTNSCKDIWFTVPLSKPIIGVSTVTLTSVNGFILREGNAYTHGSTATEYATPSSYVGYLHAANEGIKVKATFSNMTNAVDNSPIGIQWSGKITFS